MKRLTATTEPVRAVAILIQDSPGLERHDHALLSCRMMREVGGPHLYLEVAILDGERRGLAVLVPAEVFAEIARQAGGEIGELLGRE